jgi:hypothetical protein
MSMLKKLTIVVAGVFLLSVSNSAQESAEPKLAGTWQITFYLEPNHSQGATQCVSFTTTVTESSAEFSGRWSSSTFPGWEGSWRQDGDHIQWYGFTRGGLATSEFGHLPSNTVISGEFNHFIPPGGTTSSDGGWVATRVSQCLIAPGTTNAASVSDPAKLSTSPVN